ncbi:MAG: anthranilate synthase component I, partial [Phenylobacterium sp.]|nr:anthranilate synthase component I [Phenylobacterium sp.]
MTLEPGFQTFSGIYEAGRAQVVWTRLIDDLETPVSAYLKIGNGRPYAFLFESVEGGAWRGRYSVIALNPDLVWRCRGDVAEIAEGEDIAGGRFTTQPGGALDSLRDLVAASRLDLPPGLPPMAAGVFGALGYDMVRLVERLPKVNPDTMGLPDAVMIRPSVVAVFDGIAQEILLATTVRPSALSAEGAWAAARARLEAVRLDLIAPAPPPAGGTSPEPDRFTTP